MAFLQKLRPARQQSDAIGEWKVRSEVWWVEGLGKAEMFYLMEGWRTPLSYMITRPRARLLAVLTAGSRAQTRSQTKNGESSPSVSP